MKINAENEFPEKFSADLVPVFLTPRYRNFRMLYRKGDYWWFSTENSLTAFYVFKKKGFRIAKPEFGIFSNGYIDEGALLKEVIGILINDFKVDYIINGGVQSMVKEVPAIKGLKHSEMCTFVVDLSLDEENIFSRIHSKHRNSIRRAERLGVKVLRGKEYLKNALELINNSRRRGGVGEVQYRKIKLLSESLKDNFEVFVSYLNGEPQASAFLIFTQYSSYYLYGGTIEKPAPGSSNILHWEAMKHFKSIGVKKYDFMGSRCNPEKGTKHYGIHLFKSRFGGKEIVGRLWEFRKRSFKGFVFEKLYTLLLPQNDIHWKAF